jgi:hypothetical protein
MSPSRAVTVLLATALLASCGTRKDLPFGPGDGGAPDPTATFTRVQGEVFSVSCALAGCHTGTFPQAGMNLSTGASYAAIVGVPSSERSELLRIAPGDPDASYMVQKLRGTPGIAGSQMPLTGSVTDAQVKLVVDWVRRGAPRD